MAEKRKADVLAKPDSFADKLRKRRMAYENGSVEKVSKSSKEFRKKKDK